MQNTLKPQRVLVVDALRGFALFGLFIIHMVEYFELYWYSPEPGLIHDATFFIFGGKAYAIFSLLFGFSLFIIMDNSAKRGIDYSRRFIWRFLLLGLLGYLHGLIYSGDILQVLAVLGLFVLVIYKLPNGLICLVSGLLLLQFPKFVYLFISLQNPGLLPEAPFHYSLMGETFEQLANGSFRDVLQNNAYTGQLGKWVFMLESGRVSTIVGFSALGVYLGKSGFFINGETKKRFMFIATLVAIVTAILIEFALIPAMAQLMPEAKIDQWIFNGIFDSYFDTVLTFILALLFLLAYHTASAEKTLNTLVPCGQMSLTLYCTQSLYGVFMYYGYGLGLYQSFGQLNSLLLGFFLWGLQMVFAHHWMKRYHYGPLEWVWRSATLLRTDIAIKKAL